MSKKGFWAYGLYVNRNEEQAGEPKNYYRLQAVDAPKGWSDIVAIDKEVAKKAALEQFKKANAAGDPAPQL